MQGQDVLNQKTTQLDLKKVAQDLRQAIDNKTIWQEARNTHRVYTDGTKEVMIQDAKTTLENVYKTFFCVAPTQTSASTAFKDLPRATIFVGPPDTGKTYAAINYAKQNNIPYILIMGREDLTLETMLQDFILIDGKPAYNDSLALQYLSGTQDCIIIIDEFNTLRTGVLKTFQPLFDETSSDFEFKGKIYTKNLNCKFICTLNDKDKGISVLPDAILSRCSFKYFNPVDDTTLSMWTGIDPLYIMNARELFEVFGLSGIFGVRQLKIMSTLKTTADLSKHIEGLLALCNKDIKAMETPEVQARFQKLVL